MPERRGVPATLAAGRGAVHVGPAASRCRTSESRGDAIFSGHRGTIIPEITVPIPILIGTSRKSMFAQLLGRGVDKRLAGGLATTAYAVLCGAAIVRVHDVEEAADVVKVITQLI